MERHDGDLELVARFQSGDDSAFDELMRRHYRSVLNLVYRFTGADPATAEDLAQEIFLRVYRALHRFEARARFFTYLYRVTVNLCLKERKKWSRRRTVSLDAPRGDSHLPPPRQLVDPGSTAQERFERGELASAVREVVLSLPEEQRAAVILHRYHDLSYEEIAEALGISLAAVKSRLHRAKLSLQSRLAPVLEEHGRRTDFTLCREGVGS